ncbi:hypothetical protein CONLIGDRAFT_637049 [Coniochaeta ligniaria NRRL 30616]|uniref:Uncharacterized protein n=1 Tax=Coniochaeta ligniaria NRRL 30616 TaxID=1408157 RepID=A0A1J7IRT8_9PEZI|nr:hypothetical protein CONLIGDRAFT_637049 [Coniochaeta ligniaria NRRL 30616]
MWRILDSRVVERRCWCVVSVPTPWTGHVRLSGKTGQLPRASKSLTHACPRFSRAGVDLGLVSRPGVECGPLPGGFFTSVVTVVGLDACSPRPQRRRAARERAATGGAMSMIHLGTAPLRVLGMDDRGAAANQPPINQCRNSDLAAPHLRRDHANPDSGHGEPSPAVKSGPIRKRLQTMPTSMVCMQPSRDVAGNSAAGDGLISGAIGGQVKRHGVWTGSSLCLTGGQNECGR